MALCYPKLPCEHVYGILLDLIYYLRSMRHLQSPPLTNKVVAHQLVNNILPLSIGQKASYDLRSLDLLLLNFAPTAVQFIHSCIIRLSGIKESLCKITSISHAWTINGLLIGFDFPITSPRE